MFVGLLGESAYYAAAQGAFYKLLDSVAGNIDDLVLKPADQAVDEVG